MVFLGDGQKVSWLSKEEAMTFNIKSIWIMFPIILAASFLLFYPSLNYYFLQDDWFVLNWVREGNLASFFSFRQDIIYWRPISMPIFFKINQTLFDLTPTGFHLVAFGFHIINVLLIYLLFRILKISKQVSLTISFLYATAAFHFIPLSWLSTTSYIIGPTFIFATLLLFLKDKLLFAFASFLLALSSSEFGLVVIPIMLILNFSQFGNTIKKLVPFIFVAVLYLVARYLLFPLPATGQYAITISPKILTNLFWYFAWTFNMPESLSTVFYLSNFANSAKASLEFWKIFILPITLIVIFLILIAKSKIRPKTIFLGLFWFMLGLTPVIFLPYHSYPMYLVIASLGIFYILANCFDKLKKNQLLLILAFAGIWSVASYFSISFTRTNHWLVNLQKISRSYISYTQDQVPNPPPNSVFIFAFPDIKYSKAHDFVIVQSEQNIKQALNDQDAIRVVYQDNTLVSLYQTHQYIPQAPPNSVYFTIQPR